MLNINIGGVGADNDWTYNYYEVGSGGVGVLGRNAYYVIDLNAINYIPNDGCDYEIMVSGYIWNNGTINTSCSIWLYNGESPSNFNFRVALCAVTTRWTNAGCVSLRGNVLPILNGNRKICIHNAVANSRDNWQASGDWGVRLEGFRKLGNTP